MRWGIFAGSTVCACVAVLACTDEPTAPPAIASIDVLPDTVTLLIGATQRLTARLIDGSGNELTGRPVVWSTSEQSVASVSADGVVTAIAPGTATIMAKGEGRSGLGTVKVPPRPVATVVITPDSARLTVDGTQQLTVVLHAANNEVLSGRPVRWTSSDSAVVHVSASGLVTALTPGVARIEATAEGKTASVSVSVTIAFTSVVASQMHSCGLTATGRAFCWGSDFGLPLWAGDVAVTESCMHSCYTKPLPVPGGLRFSRLTVGSGGLHTCGIASDAVYCWGTPLGGFGDGTSGRSSPVPQRVPSVEKYTAVDGGFWHTCAVTAAGLVECWGANMDGQLGDSTVSEICLDMLASTCSRFPRRVPNLTNITEVASGWAHVCALAVDGIAHCWGYNSSGQVGAVPTDLCGSGQRACNRTPVRLELQLKKIAAGAATCGLTDSGLVYCWGNFKGSRGPSTDSWRFPELIASGQSFAQVFAGGGHACALTATGVAFCWGRNDKGQVGDGSQEARPIPLAIGGDLRFKQLGLGNEHSCGITTDNFAYCWGDNRHGQLGIGSTATALIPTRVTSQ